MPHPPATISGSLEPPPTVTRAPWLIAVFNAAAPLAPAARHRLDRIDEVGLGRTGGARWKRAGKRLALALDDARASVAHARLERVLQEWVIEDLGSRNGTFVNGERVTRTELTDGDLIELGHSFFVFRELDGSGDEADDEEVVVDTAMPCLATLRTDLARELARLRLAAASREAIMILGESGTGKELVARAVHRLSGRPGAFVPVNCAAIVESMVEAELFGHRRGAFSGASADRPGFFRAADRGTLFLDEIGDLRPSSQAVLLRALQEQEVVPVGGEQAVKVNLRVVCATHRELAQLVGEGGFRADLHARLRGFVLRLPPLRERREDLGLIIATLLRQLLGDAAPSVRFSGTAARALLLHEWPANVRELEKALGTAIALADGGAIVREHLPPLTAGEHEPASTTTGSRAELKMDRARLIELLREHGGNVSAIARATGKAPTQVRRWLVRFDIDADAYRSS